MTSYRRLLTTLTLLAPAALATGQCRQFLLSQDCQASLAPRSQLRTVPFAACRRPALASAGTPGPSRPAWRHSICEHQTVCAKHSCLESANKLY